MKSFINGTQLNSVFVNGTKATSLYKNGECFYRYQPPLSLVFGGHTHVTTTGFNHIYTINIPPKTKVNQRVVLVGFIATTSTTGNISAIRVSNTTIYNLTNCEGIRAVYISNVSGTITVTLDKSVSAPATALMYWILESDGQFTATATNDISSISGNTSYPNNGLIAVGWANTVTPITCDNLNVDRPTTIIGSTNFVIGGWSDIVPPGNRTITITSARSMILCSFGVR